MVYAFTVDYTTNEFLGGYTVPFPAGSKSLKMAYDYKSPGDFGSVRWYDELSGTDLFAGTIVWMGTGKRTFPENISPASDFAKVDKPAVMPSVYPLYHGDALAEYKDYAPIWKAIANLQAVSWVEETTPTYAYLYAPSVGEGDPKEWYWVFFLIH
ncbi:hypothetical protein [Bacteroides sp. 51]|uniref:hypothetical protein n=1 Tax=Bacteroides sp. 51 TaxID=2302938 RepID=UPI0013D88C95|nr:hypothetical protein [Bacteroides sp. 51]NDV83933.1 hypothetical protein [Bacteroides sp. 51]